MSFRVPPRRVLVPMDFSPCAERALEVACDLALRVAGSHLILVHGWAYETEFVSRLSEGDRFVADVERVTGERLGKRLAELQQVGISAEWHAIEGPPDRAIVGVAEEEGADLIVMGTEGRTGLARLALGSVAARVVQHAPCPVMTLKEDDRDTPAAA